MQIDVKEIYNHAFAAQRHASDFRAKIIAGWSVMHTAIATVFVWVQANQRSLAWVVLYAGAIMTLLMWLADKRNLTAIRRAKDIGAAFDIL